jgi:hypothetical protein
MGGYFYNDARVREAGTFAEVVAALERGTQLVLCGPGERRTIEATPGLRVQVLAEGPRANVLLRVWRE